ncbi:hypothetical protein [Streptomyces sp. TLI_146]|uniref:hypothetical protein n=1 Tax=Streptomyces sp. TLI_146 TaxID=1938858 RepID=UPI000CA97CE6|nr:hypothetical protein [Streptomyces sp. TLI_146]PKV89315.1 hypothetical protein BX283_6951 [Streptomyces sp. TLI_146]
MDPGKQPLLFLLLGFLGAFLFIRFGVRMIRAEIEAAVCGIGTALVLDEFALIPHLRDVYWSEEGRLSVDSVVLGAAVWGTRGLAPSAA